MTRRNSTSFARTVKNVSKALNSNPSAKTSGVKVLRQLGVIKPQRRTGVLARIQKLLK